MDTDSLRAQREAIRGRLETMLLEAQYEGRHHLSRDEHRRFLEGLDAIEQISRRLEWAAIT
jgi:hypothetical protein